MQIGKVQVSTTWTKVSDLIKAQVSGQSAFNFSSSYTYEMQGEANTPIRLCVSATTPSAGTDGKRIKGTQVANYVPETGNYIYARCDEGVSLLNVDRIGL